MIATVHPAFFHVRVAGASQQQTVGPTFGRDVAGGISAERTHRVTLSSSSTGSPAGRRWHIRRGETKQRSSMIYLKAIRWRQHCRRYGVEYLPPVLHNRARSQSAYGRNRIAFRLGWRRFCDLRRPVAPRPGRRMVTAAHSPGDAPQRLWRAIEEDGHGAPCTMAGRD